MAERYTVVGLISDAVRSALKAAAPTMPMAALLLAAAGAYGGTLGHGAWMSGAAWLAIFAAGVWYSLNVYRVMMETRSGTALSLAHANFAIYSAFLFIGVFVGLFLLILPGILLETAGYEDLGSETDPQIVLDALRQMLPTAYGAVLIVANLMGALCLSFFALRLICVGPATVQASAAMVFRTWRWTEGHALRLGAAALVTHVLPFAVAVAVNAALRPLFDLTNPVMTGISSMVGMALFLPFLLLGHGLAVAAHAHLAPTE